jgi:invasion protein IalB
MARVFLILVSLTVLASAVQAQSPPPNAPKASWVKLCDKGTLTAKDKDGNEGKKDVNICHTLAERIDANSGKVIVSTGLNQVKVDNEEKQIFRVILPLDVVLPPGIAVTFFPKDLWAKVEKNEKLEKDDESRLKTVKMDFLFCNEVGCHAETEANEEILKSLKSSAGFVVTAANRPGVQIDLRVSLAGFKEALEGAPLQRRNPRYDRPIRCDMVVDDHGPCNARSLLKR